MSTAKTYLKTKNHQEVLFVIFILLIMCQGCKNESVIEDPDGNTSPPADTLCTDTLYVGGLFISAGDSIVNNIAMWDGENWHPLGKGITGHASIDCMAFYKNDLYAGGFIDSAGGVPAKNIARWDGVEWRNPGTGINGLVNSLIVYKDELYAGGWFSSAGGLVTPNIAKWNGISWSPVGEGFSDEVYTLCIFKDMLYAGGWFTKTSNHYFSADNIARWNGAKWDTVGSGVKGEVPGGSWIKNLAVFNNELYASGNFQRCGSLIVNNIARWNGNNWSVVGEGINTILSYTMTEYNNELLVGGEMESPYQIRRPYFFIWDGTNWKPGNFTMDSTPYRFYTSGNDLYVGGIFNYVNGFTVNGVFRWDGHKIYSIGNGVEGCAASLMIKKSGNINP